LKAGGSRGAGAGAGKGRRADGRALYRPMLAESSGAPFSSDDWLFEVKWDGIRAISYVGPGEGQLSIRSRNGIELRWKFPELGELEGLVKDAVLDGEIVVMKDGRADFQAVLERMQAGSAADAAYLSKAMPATYVVFDILEKVGKALTGLRLDERLSLLRGALKEGDHVAISRPVEGAGEEYYDAAVGRGVEGVVAKRKDSAYEQGRRSQSWLKIKKVKSCDCAIFGYTKGSGSREGAFGALLLGLYDRGKAVFVGKVGTGFSERGLRMMAGSFAGLESGRTTLDGVSIGEEIVWLRPELVCEVEYQTVTHDGKLRMPRFKRLREDKAPEECTADQIRPVERLGDYRAKRDFGKTHEPSGMSESEGGGVKMREDAGKVRKGKGKENGEVEVEAVSADEPSKIASGAAATFVIHEHHSRRLHFDLRLERDGVLKSWAVPKGLPTEAGERRLAIKVEDHPLEYGKFEGTIPEGQYGAGTVSIWESGVYRAIEWGEDKIEVIMEGEKGKARGRYALVRFKKAGENQWLVLKAGD